jgi:biopolymer transport protein TolR
MARLHSKRGAMHEINVVPYIDVMLVLLVIFMVTAPMMTTANIDLPSVGKAATMPAQPLEVAIKADQTLMLTDRAGNKGEIRVDRKELIRLVTAAQAKNPEQPVLIAGDRNVKYEAVLSVMDELQRAQVKRVGLLVQTTGR